MDNTYEAPCSECGKITRFSLALSTTTCPSCTEPVNVPRQPLGAGGTWAAVQGVWALIFLIGIPAAFIIGGLIWAFTS